MALRINDGFDIYGNDAQLQQRGKWAGQHFDGSRPRTGPGCIRWESGAVLHLEAAYATGTVGFAIQPSDLSQQPGFVFANNTSGVSFFTFQVFNDGHAAILLGNGGAVLAASPLGAIQLNVWTYMEIQWKTIGPTTTIEFHKNGVPFLGPVVANTSASASAVDLVFGRNTIFGTYWDDYFERDDAVFMGDRSCYTLFETANGPVQNWTANGDANAWQCLNHVPSLPTTNFISSGTVNDVSNFECADLAPEIGNIGGLTLYVQANKSDSGPCTIQAGINSGGTVGNIPDINPGTGNNYYPGVMENDPNTGIAWTNAGINAMRPTAKRTL